MGNNDIKDDGDGCYIVEAENAADKFYNTKTEDKVTSYTFASYIRNPHPTPIKQMRPKSRSPAHT